MNDGIYSDTYVHSRLSPKRLLRRNLMIAACVVVPLVGFILIGGWLAILASLIIEIVLIYYLPNKKIDYEYVFVDGQIDFDRIIAGTTRKNMMQADLESTDIVAPENSHSLDGYQKLEIMDFSSGDPADKHYVMVVKSNEGKQKIRFTPDEKLLEQMKLKARSKIEY